jgi:hypothetical protein
MTQNTFSWQFPEDTNTEEVGVWFMIQQFLARCDFCKVVQVTAVHPGSGSPPVAGTVDVQILVNQIDGANPPNSQPHGIVYGLPYLRLQAGTWAVVADPAVGDIGFAVVSDRDISTVKATQAQANPGSQRRYSVSDGIYCGGILNKAPTSWLWLKSDGTVNMTDSKGNSLVSSSTGWAMKGNLAVTGSISATGDVSGPGQVSLQNHLHSGVQTGGGQSGPPVPGT